MSQSQNKKPIENSKLLELVNNRQIREILDENDGQAMIKIDEKMRLLISEL